MLEDKLRLIFPSISNQYQMHSSKGVLRKRCSENMQQTYRRTPMLKCDFNKVVRQLYCNHALAGVLTPVNLLHNFRTPFP